MWFGANFNAQIESWENWAKSRLFGYNKLGIDKKEKESQRGRQGEKEQEMGEKKKCKGRKKEQSVIKPQKNRQREQMPKQRMMRISNSLEAFRSYFKHQID